MRDNWNLATFDAQVRILTYMDEGKKLIKAYSAIIYGSMFMYMILPVTPSIIAFFANANQTQMYGVIYHAETIFDVKKYYYFILLHSYYTTFFLMTIPVATDSMLIIYVQHACGLFEVIGYELENMKQDDNIYINAYPRHEDDENYRIISNSVAKHVKVLQFAKLFASTYSISLFIMTLLNTVFIAFSGIQVVINMDRPLEALRFTVAGLCLVLHFLFLSLPGQKLIDHSSKVHESM
ncbi:uncharacterized protein LOC116851307 [Odontomachus brunneus]|uniref:uncharacterized protein LOC116851307 n=1 Tax=Odontomachus brunneus TaxID=486640 RepID=UPI0013F20C0C|nr:uncharacterized protein LOC116851307 [Odontomachus brunneus]